MWQIGFGREMNFKRMNNNYLQVTFRLAVLVGCRLGSTEVPTPSPKSKSQGVYNNSTGTSYQYNTGSGRQVDEIK